MSMPKPTCSAATSATLAASLSLLISAFPSSCQESTHTSHGRTRGRQQSRVFPSSRWRRRPKRGTGETVAKKDKLDPGQAYYYNLATGRVERGLVSDWIERMGPYATEAEAANALQRAQARNEEWERQDREWDGDDED